MTTTPDVFGTRHAVLDRTERAQEAIKVFRQMQAQLSAFARALTGRRDIKVVLDTGTPRTDGKNIWYRPPITLGDKYKHERPLCEKRGSDKMLLCMACAQREEVLAVIYHEIAHIAFDSFDPPTDEQRKAIITRAIKQAGGKRSEAIAARIEASPYWQTNSYRGLASLVSQYLPFIVNCLEDARVNREMFKARPGTKVMFETDAYRALSQGVEQADGSVVQWRDYPLNAQVSVSLLCKAAGYTFGADLLHPVIAEAMADKKLTGLVNRMDSVRSVSGVYELSLPILQRLQDLGFCIDHPEDEPEPEPESEEPQPDEQSDDKTEEPSDDAGEADDAQDDEGDGDSDADDSPSESGGEDAGKSGDSDDTGADEGAAGDEVADDGGNGTGSDESEGGDSADGASDGMGDGEPGESGGEGSSGEDEEGSPDDAGSSPDGTADDGDGSGDPSDDGEAGDEGGEVGTGTIGDEPASGDAGGEAGSGDGDRGEGERDEADSDSSRGDDAGQEGPGGADGGTGEPDAGGAEGDEASDDAEASGATHPPSDDAGSDFGDGTESGSDQNMAPEHAGDGDDKAASRSSVGDPSDGTSPVEEGGSDGASPTLDGADDDGDRTGYTPEELDTGADQGMGGAEAGSNRDDEVETPDMGDASDAKKALKVFGGHEEVAVTLEEEADKEALNVAIIQGLYFEQPSAKVTNVRVHQYGKHHDASDVDGWTHQRILEYFDEDELPVTGVRCDVDIPESVLGPCLTRMRVAFSDNKRNRMQPNLKAGRIRKQALGKRAWGDDGRLFQKKTIAKKRDYMVVIGIDISGSTTGVNLTLAKRAAMAQAELCHRLGVKFAVYAHSAQRKNMHNYSGPMSLEMYEIKGADEPWASKQKEALNEIGPVADNLDGHSIEFYRKILDASTATDNIILYYTDGKMPAANHDEELEILIREIKTCKARGYHLMGVGIRTDSPTRHGLDTVQVDTDDDLIKVVQHLEKRLV